MSTSKSKRNQTVEKTAQATAEAPTSKKQPMQTFYFPEKNLKVEATTLKEAIAKANSKKEGK